MRLLLLGTALWAFAACTSKVPSDTPDASSLHVRKITYVKPQPLLQVLRSLGLEKETARMSSGMRNSQMSFETQDHRKVLLFCDPESLIISSNDLDKILKNPRTSDHSSSDLRASRIRVNAIIIER